MEFKYSVHPLFRIKNPNNFAIVAKKEEVKRSSSIKSLENFNKFSREYGFNDQQSGHLKILKKTKDSFTIEGKQRQIPIYWNFRKTRGFGDLGILTSIGFDTSSGLYLCKNCEDLPSSIFGDELPSDFINKNHIWLADRVNTSETNNLLLRAFFTYSNS